MVQELSNSFEDLIPAKEATSPLLSLEERKGISFFGGSLKKGIHIKKGKYEGTYFLYKESFLLFLTRNLGSFWKKNPASYPRHAFWSFLFVSSWLMMRKCVFFVLFFELFCFSSVVVSQDTPREITKVVFFLNGALEHAWAFRNELGRQGVATTLSDQVLTSVVTTNEWDPNTTIPIVEKFIENGYKIVFFTSTGFGRTTAPGVAKRFPDVLFIQMPAVVLNPELTNLIEVDGLLYQPSYLAGILGGHMTETNKVGFLTGPLSNINAKAINSYCLGTHLVNPDVECYAIVMPSFTDPRMHKQGTEQLLAMGVDNVMGYTGNVIPSTMVAARFDQGESVYSAGWTDDFRAKIGPSVLTSSMFNFADLYADIVARYLAGEGRSD